MIAETPGPPEAGLLRARPDAARLREALAHIRASPRERGELVMLVRRPVIDGREVVGSAELDVQWGLVGDSWSTRPEGPRGDGPARDRQVTVMNSRAAAAVAGDDDQAMALAGDQLLVDLDLSVENLPAGSLLRVGDATLEVSEEPHLGCGKFARRFGADALAFVNCAEGRALRLRGLNARVIKGATVRIGDPVRPARLGTTSSP